MSIPSKLLAPIPEAWGSEHGFHGWLKIHIAAPCDVANRQPIQDNQHVVSARRQSEDHTF
jgi:hypothetical protein